MTQHEEWERDHATLQQAFPVLRKTHVGQYVAIHEGRIVDSDADEWALIDRTFARLDPLASFHVALVTDGEPLRLTNFSMNWSDEDIRDFGRASLEYLNRIDEWNPDEHGNPGGEA